MNIEAPIVVRQLRYEDVPRASKTLVNEFEAGIDPLYQYLRDTPDAKKFPKYITKSLRRGMFMLYLSSWVRNGLGLTIEGGVSLVAAVPPPKSRRGRRKKRITDKLLVQLSALFSLILDSPEQRRRLKEFNTAADALVKEVLGEQALEMWTIDSLVTDPKYRRRGFAGALVDTITRQADLECRCTMLLSSNLANNEFYNSHGFTEIAHVEVGGDNPSWRGPPVLVPLMIREVQRCDLKLSSQGHGFERWKAVM